MSDSETERLIELQRKRDMYAGWVDDVKSGKTAVIRTKDGDTAEVPTTSKDRQYYEKKIAEFDEDIASSSAPDAAVLSRICPS